MESILTCVAVSFVTFILCVLIFLGILRCFYVDIDDIAKKFCVFAIIGLAVMTLIVLGHYLITEVKAPCNQHKETVCECCECREKITESQYQEAKVIVDKYEKQK